MLVLGRKNNEKVIILSPSGESITVTVCTKKNGHFRLGFEAPRNYRIIRGESLAKQQDAAIKAAR